MNLLQQSLSVYGTRNEPLAQRYLEMAELFETKHWHQLTNAVEDLCGAESCLLDENLVMLYEDVLAKCEAKLNPIRLVKICERVAQQYLHSSPPSAGELDKALGFMARLAGKPFLGEEARVMAQMLVAELQVQRGASAAALELITQAAPAVRALEGTGAESAVKSSFFRAETAYYKQAGPAGNFYRSAIQYLAHTPASSLSAARREELAVDVSLAALVADDVYNMGEVLAQEIVAGLGQDAGGPHAWLHETLRVFSAGDVAAYNRLVEAHRDAFGRTTVLAANLALLKQKIALLCLMRVVFDRPPHERAIAFDDIARAAKLPEDQVEWLVMRAFSQKLLRGSIDQVAGVVHVSWLLPRVLDAGQTNVLDEKLVAWTASVDAALQFETPLVHELF